MLILLTALVGALLIVGITKPEILESRLVRGGAAVLFITAGLVFLLPAMITGLLFFLAAPIALLSILVGTILTFVRSDKRMHEAVGALDAAARRTTRLWPDDSPVNEVDEVVKHGLDAGPALVSLLRFESEEQFSDSTWSPSVEQQAALALCRIYGEAPVGARTVYDTRSTSTDNSRVKHFWQAKIRGTAK
jgi:hypothetical protein